MVSHGTGARSDGLGRQNTTTEEFDFGEYVRNDFGVHVINIRVVQSGCFGMKEGIFFLSVF